jgi:hypothetical protein
MSIAVSLGNIIIITHNIMPVCGDQASSVANGSISVEDVAIIQCPSQLLGCSLRQCKTQMQLHHSFFAASRIAGKKFIDPATWPLLQRMIFSATR